MLMLMLVSFGFTACSDDDDEPAATSALVGNWQQVNDAGTTITVTFRNNGSGVINYSYRDGSGDSNENFEYDYIENDRELTVIGSSLQGNYYVTLTATKLLLSRNGYSYEFTKK